MPHSNRLQKEDLMASPRQLRGATAPLLGGGNAQTPTRRRVRDDEEQHGGGGGGHQRQQHLYTVCGTLEFT